MEASGWLASGTDSGKNRTNGRTRMSIGRRETSNMRRRRLLVYQNSREDVAATAADRRQFEKLREARRPTEIYGTSVNRKLRGRWFSLVPVRRRAMAGVAVAILGVATLLCLGHWAAVAWQPLAYRPELARPLRLDRPDSFGAWVRAVFFAAAAGTSLLVYQLRRYRNDDFRGSYRIWPPMILLMCLASLDSVCQLVPWGGELIELVMGRRVALTGGDWIRIVITVGGIALAMRVIAEVRHSKLAILMMSSAFLGFAIPMAARWGVLADDTPIRWLMITSAPMMASASLWVACGAYLRKLFREVRKMDAEDALSLRIEQWRERISAMRQAAKRDREQAAVLAKEAKSARTSAKTAAKKGEKSHAVESQQHSGAVATSGASATVAVAKPSATVAQPSVAVAKPSATVAQPSATGDSFNPEQGKDEKESQKSRFSFRFWRRNKSADESGSKPDGAIEPNFNAAHAAKKPDPVNVQPAVVANQAAAASDSPPPHSAGVADAADDANGDGKPRKGGIFGWFGKKKATAVDAGSSSSGKPGGGTPLKPGGSKTQDQDDNEPGDGDDPSIDWASMGKAERRRLRREIKRGGQAA